MRKAMVFIDYENFDIARQELYKPDYAPRLDFPSFPLKLCKKISTDLDLIKTFLFIPKPDSYLMQQEWRKKRYVFLKGLENINYFSVIEGRHCVRPASGGFDTIDIRKKDTYYVNEKGTDINITAQLLTKAFHNSYDTAIVISGDTDYIPVFDLINTLGKTVISVGVEGQNLQRFRTHTDRQYTLYRDFLDECVQKKESEERAQIVLL